MGNVWDEDQGYVTRAYDNEFDFDTEEDPSITEAIEYVTVNGDNTMPYTQSTWPVSENLQRILFGTGNENSVSNVGTNHTPSLQRGNSMEKK